ncbi:MAG: hypothetical protein ACREFT_04075 [Acetobacteraceae bacterium]
MAEVDAGGAIDAKYGQNGFGNAGTRYPVNGQPTKKLARLIKTGVE